MKRYLLVSDRSGTDAVILSIENGALQKYFILNNGAGKMTNTLKAWETDGIDFISEVREETETGIVQRLVTVQVKTQSKEAYQAIRRWVSQNGYRDLPLSQQVAKCAVLLAKASLRPEERTALIESVVHMDAHQVEEVENQLELIVS